MDSVLACSKRLPLQRIDRASSGAIRETAAAAALTCPDPEPAPQVSL